MAAAIFLKISEREGVAKQVLSKGKYFCDQLESVAKKQNFPLLMTGPPSMPYPFVEEILTFLKSKSFADSVPKKVYTFIHIITGSLAMHTPLNPSIIQLKRLLLL